MSSVRRFVSARLVAACTAFVACLSPAGAHGLNHNGTCAGTFAPADNPHVLTGGCSVPTGQTLTLLPGVILNGQNNTLEVRAGSTLLAVGTSAVQRDVQLQNLFISFDGISGTDPPSAGQVANCTLTGGRIAIDDGAPTVQSCTILVSGNDAIDITGAAHPMITGNTITVNSNQSAVFVRDTAQPMITGNSITTNGAGLYFQNSSAGTASANMIGFLSGARSNRWGINVQDNAVPIVDGNTITDDIAEPDLALRLVQNAGVPVHVTNNVVQGSGGDIAVALTPNAFGSGSMITGNQFPAAALWTLSGTVSGTATIGPVNGQTTYVLTNNVVVSNGATLTIQPGITLVGQNNNLEVQAGGTLNAMGTSAVQRDLQLQGVYVYFDGRNGLTAAAAGQMKNCTLTGGRISIADGAPTVQSCTINVAGNDAFAITGGAQAQITGNNITENSNYSGIFVRDTAQPLITGNTIITNGAGLYYQNNSAGTASGNTIGFLSGARSNRWGINVQDNATPALDGNTINNDPAEPDVAFRLVQNAGVAAHVTNNVIQGNSGDIAMALTPNTFGPSSVIMNNQFPAGLAWTVSGTLSGSATIGAIDGQTTYVFTGDVVVSTGATLTIQPGITLVGQNNNLEVQAGGTLNAVGTSAMQRDLQLQNMFVYFDGRNGIVAAATGQMKNCSLFGGRISITDGAPTVQNCTLNVTGNDAIAITGSAQPQIVGNSITENSNYSGIFVRDSAQPVITGNTITTNGAGLYFQNSSAGTVSGNAIGFLSGARSNRWGINVQDNAIPVLDSNTITDDATESDVGLRLVQNAGVAVHVTNNVVQGSVGDVSVALTPNTLGPGSVIMNNQFPTGVPWTLSGTLTGPATIASIDGQKTYVLIGNIVVSNGATLTMRPGITVIGQNNNLEVQAGGTLNATGSSDMQRDLALQNVYVYFDGRNGVTAPATGQMKNCTLTGGRISITDGAPTVQSCTILATGNDAIDVAGSSQVSISGSIIGSTATGVQLGGTAQATLSNNLIAAGNRGIDVGGNCQIQAQGNNFIATPNAVYFRAPGMPSTLADNTFTNNTASIAFDQASTLFNAFPEMFDSNTFVGSAELNLIQLPSPLAITAGATLGAHVVPYLASGLTVNQGATLVLEPGVVFKSTSFSNIDVNGDLIAVGTADRPIVFSSRSPKNGTR
ncbi:MAG: right-handed parallel beta-helix repeat-containing protein, partial [Deltaproteobacteria bacterium]|nr:right-handed parallel beta-helix repeat-containing protein [Deltaproteobacteria bacterium]